MPTARLRRPDRSACFRQSRQCRFDSGIKAGSLFPAPGAFVGGLPFSKNGSAPSAARARSDSRQWLGNVVAITVIALPASITSLTVGYQIRPLILRPA